MRQYCPSAPLAGSGLLGREPAPHGVLGDGARHHELQEVVRAARLIASTRHPKSAERLAPDDCASGFAVQVEVPDRELAPRERPIDPMITHTLKLEDINKGFDLMHAGESIRSVVIY